MFWKSSEIHIVRNGLFNRVIVPRSATHRSWSLAILWIAIAGTSASAINIIPIYESASSIEPSQDPTGGLLTSIFTYVEGYYQGIFEDTRTITIHYWWEDLDFSSTGTLGLHNRLTESGGYNIESNIRLDNDRNWFIDPTPADDSEFNLQQTLWRDLSAAEQSDYFNNFTVGLPATFEVGYRGAAVPGSAAEGVADLLSTVLHEVGHALGLTGATNSVTETNDGDYDFSTTFLRGQTLAAEHQSGDMAHLDDAFALMCGGCGASGIRRRPSHTDLFSMASANDFLTLDTPRREFYGGSDWNTPGNWSGNQVPAFNDDASIRNPGSTVTANLSANGAAASLLVGEGSNVNTNAFKLDIGGTATIRDPNTDVNVPVGGELEAAAILIQNGADLNVQGGLVDVVSLTIENGAASSRLTGTGGTVDVQSSLVNNGVIQALSGGTLTFVSGSESVWNLDGNTGAGTGIVRATTGDLHFATGSLTDAFDGAMEIGDFVDARTLTLASPWTLGANGTLTMTGGAAAGDRAALAGGQVLVQGTLTANFGVNHINAPAYLNGATVDSPARLEFNAQTFVSFGDFDAGPSGAIVLDGVTTFVGGANTLSGLWQQNGAATVQGASVIVGGAFDMDGASGGTVWTISNNLRIEADSIDTGTLNQFNGVLNINNAIADGRLEVYLPGNSTWTMAGTLNIDTGTIQTLNSLRTPSVRLTGVTNLNGGTAFQANATMIGQVNLTANSKLSLQPYTGATTYSLEGATIAGPTSATLEVKSTANLYGRGTINTRLIGDVGSSVLAVDGTLVINGPLGALGTIGTLAGGGPSPVLQVTNVWNTASASELHLQGGTVAGASIINGGVTRGFGHIVTPGFQNDGILSADGGHLIVQTTTFPDLDGFFNLGEVNAVQGPLTILPEGGTQVFRGTINVGFFPNLLNIPNAVIHNRGTIHLHPGDFNARGFILEGNVQVDTGLSQFGESGSGIQFVAGGTTDLQGNLQLVGNATVHAGAVISGPGRLEVYTGGHLDLAHGATVAAGVLNKGELEVGSSPGFATVDRFEQTVAGTYVAEIDGLQRGAEYDQLEVTQSAALAGILDIQLNQNGGNYADPTVPGTYHVFGLLTGNGIGGDFDSVLYAGNPLVPVGPVGPGGDFVSLAECGLFRIMDYAVNSVELTNYRALPGDANADGLVDGSDFGIWNANKFTNGTTWARGDFNCDGVTDGSDFGIWNANKFTGAPLPISFSDHKVHSPAFGTAFGTHLVPEPSGGCSLFLVLLGFKVLRRWGNRSA